MNTLFKFTGLAFVTYLLVAGSAQAGEAPVNVCVSSNGRIVYVQDEGTECRRGYNTVTLAVEGPQGEAGVDGNAGPTGPQGAAGNFANLITYTNTNTQLTPTTYGGVLSLTASCDAGDLLTGGSCFLDTVSTFGIRIFSSLANPATRTYLCEAECVGSLLRIPGSTSREHDSQCISNLLQVDAVCLGEN